MGAHKRAPLAERIKEAQMRDAQKKRERDQLDLMRVTEEDRRRESEMLQTEAMLKSYFNYMNHINGNIVS